MPVLRVGSTEIPYEIRASDRAVRLRVVVTPGRVEVITPPEASPERIAAFVQQKRRFIYNRAETLRERALLVSPPRYISGAKILFRGRLLKLRVEPADVFSIELNYATAFHLRVPRDLPEEDRERQVESTVLAWLRARVEEDAKALVRRHAPRLGTEPAGVRLGSPKTKWGSCGTDRILRLHWRLVAAPRPVLEYVVVHELCHLIERHHGPTFWRRVGTLLPDWEIRHAWLMRHGVELE